MLSLLRVISKSAWLCVCEDAPTPAGLASSLVPSSSAFHRFTFMFHGARCDMAQGASHVRAERSTLIIILLSIYYPMNKPMDRLLSAVSP
jgi:hypothetical protein